MDRADRDHVGGLGRQLGVDGDQGVAFNLVTATHSAYRSLPQSCSRAIGHTVRRDTRSPRSRILTSVIRSWRSIVSDSLRTRTDIEQLQCSPAERIELDASSRWSGWTDTP